MSISVEHLSETTCTEHDWDEWLEQSSMGTPFHQFDVLRLMAAEVGATQFDFHGALERRTSGAKAKFSPELVPTYDLTRQHRVLQLRTWVQQQKEDLSSVVSSEFASIQLPALLSESTLQRFSLGDRALKLRKRL
ncbi:hypothetical protein [Haloprofundus salinisoli]|uniref:hypothetical protein n=1 Tax=Haloprofundus salinisoli TaxID=2876193 RepID=UPI001CCDB47E|nr:hypothetical protein [Haloprofundus salinisoli]